MAEIIVFDDSRARGENDDNYAYHKAEQDLQKHIMSIYGTSGKKSDMFRPSLSDNAKIGFFSLDRASQTDVTEIIDLKDLTQVLQTLLKDSANLRRDINLTKHVMQADHEAKLQEKSLELYCRINERVVELEKNHQDRVNSLRKAFRQQLADAISRLSVHYSKNLQSRMVRERSKQKNDTADREEKFKEMQATIIRNEGIIQMLKMQLQQQQMQSQDDEDERFMNRTLDATRTQEDLEEQLSAVQEQLEEAKQKQETSDKKISRLEEALEIKEEEISTLHTDLDFLKEQLERSNIMVEQMRHEQMEMANEASREKETSRKMLGQQKDEMKRLMDEQIRLAREEAMAKMKEESSKTQTGEQTKLKQLQEKIANLESQLTKEKEKNNSLNSKSVDTKAVKEMEEKLRSEIIRLQGELEKTHHMWEKKFAILQQSMHALKDESYLRQTLQRQAAQLHHAAVSYSVDMPSGISPVKEHSSPLKKPLPDIGKRNKRGGSQSQDKDCISYTVSAPSGRGTAMFSTDEDQIMSENDLGLIPADVLLLPAPLLPGPLLRNTQDCGDQSRPSTQPHIVVLPSIEAK